MSDRILVSQELAADLVRQQFPRWSDLKVIPVTWNGWDNTTFCLGSNLKLRFPTAKRYEAAISKELSLLPQIASQLPCQISTPVCGGSPSRDYPYNWAVYNWIEGDMIGQLSTTQSIQLAQDLAQFLVALHNLSPSSAPLSGDQNFHRGGDLHVYDAETRSTLARLANEVDQSKALAIWDQALSARQNGLHHLIHGDVAAGNMLIRNGRLHAVIDFGQAARGDPACDLVPAWTLFSGTAREAFKSHLSYDGRTWARARGWALWKALLTLQSGQAVHPAERAAQDIITDILGELGG